jgi:hypothetical protein
MLQDFMDATWSRENDRTDVSCLTQQKDYSQTFHLIDKGNGKESKYDMSGKGA